VLLRVTHDRALSTPSVEVYWARSDSTEGLRHKVVYEARSRRWFCDPATCPGFRRHGHCRHQRRAARLRAVNWWHCFYLGWGPGDLQAERARLLAREADGWPLTEDELAALDALASLLGEPEEEAA
jgi:hypothetical protein